jgi:hypothetical protein
MKSKLYKSIYIHDRLPERETDKAMLNDTVTVPLFHNSSSLGNGFYGFDTKRWYLLDNTQVHPTHWLEEVSQDIPIVDRYKALEIMKQVDKLWTDEDELPNSREYLGALYNELIKCGQLKSDKIDWHETLEICRAFINSKVNLSESLIKDGKIDVQSLVCLMATGYHTNLHITKTNAVKEWEEAKKIIELTLLSDVGSDKLIEVLREPPSDIEEKARWIVDALNKAGLLNIQ